MGSMTTAFLVAPNSFKESLTARQAARAIRKGLRRALPRARIDLCPLADGGDGTALVLTALLGGRFLTSTVTGPLGRPVRARWGWIKRTSTAVLDAAAASGLALVPDRARNPLQTTTYGTGELIARAIRRGARHVIVGVGGSATVDGGLGAAQALGARLFGSDERILTRPASGKDLSRVRRVEAPRLNHVKITILCDVKAPLTGPHGAARVFGPQKGATPRQVFKLERGLSRWENVLHQSGYLPRNRASGAGAAGGLGFGLAALFGARLAPGIDFILNAARFDAKIKSADVVLTGEGRVDGSSVDGKVISGVIKSAVRRGKPVVVFGGSAGPGAQKILKRGARKIVVIADKERSLERALRDAAKNLEKAAAGWAERQYKN
jgi:glycerate kinase